MDYSESTDERLIELYRGGDEAAFDEIYERYKNTTKILSRPYYLVGGDKEDLLQEGLWGLFKAVESYDAEKGSFKNYANRCIKTKMFSAMDKANSKKNEPLAGYVSIYAPSAEVEGLTCKNPEESIIEREDSAEKVNLINKKLSKYEILVLKLYLEGFSYKEIGQKLGKEAKSVDNALNRIKRKIESLG